MSHLPDLDRLPKDIVTSTRAVVWKWETRDGKPTKPPYIAVRPNEKASVDDPRTWSPFSTAYDAVADGRADGIGIVLTGDGLVVIDLDRCRNPLTGEISPEAMAIIRMFNSFTEISVSMEGIHIWILGELPPGGRRRPGIEIYSDKRYLTISGLHLPGTPTEIHERKAELITLYQEIFGTTSRTTSTASSTSSRSTSLTDFELVMKATAAVNGSRFSSLMNGDTSEYGGDDSAVISHSATCWRSGQAVKPARWIECFAHRN